MPSFVAEKRGYGRGGPAAENISFQNEHLLTSDRSADQRWLKSGAIGARALDLADILCGGVVTK